MLFVVSVSTHRYTTAEAAEAAGVSRATLQEWLKTGKIKGPALQIGPGGRAVRMWSAADIKCMKGLKGKVMRKGRGRKKAK